MVVCLRGSAGAKPTQKLYLFALWNMLLAILAGLMARINLSINISINYDKVIEESKNS